MTADKVMVK